MANTVKKAVVIPCPDCNEEISLGPAPAEGQKVTCPNCWAYLEAVSLNPLKLSWDDGDITEDQDNDWDDDPDDSDDDR